MLYFGLDRVFSHQVLATDPDLVDDAGRVTDEAAGLPEIAECLRRGNDRLVDPGQG